MLDGTGRVRPLRARCGYGRAPMTTANLDRFTGFADLYDNVRPAPPAKLGRLLAAYAGVPRPQVVDLGSGSGLSTRWAAAWAASVVGIEPNADMRAAADSRPAPGVTVKDAVAHATGLPDRSADVVVAVQALHWMDPEPTLAEVARILRPGGVLAAIDADWPPVAGNARAEGAWVAIDRRFRVLEERLTAGEDPRAPIDESALQLGTQDGGGGQRSRGPGVQSWDKSGHLQRMRQSGHFAYVREVAVDEVVEGGAERFAALLRSHGTYQMLSRAGLSDEELGVTQFDADVRGAYAAASVPYGLGFTWRARLAVLATDPAARRPG